MSLRSIVAGSLNSFKFRAAFIVLDVEPLQTWADQIVKLRAIEDTKSNTNRHQ